MIKRAETASQVKVDGRRPPDKSRQGAQPAAMAMLRAARPHQYVKNALIFVPIVTSGRSGNPELVWLSLLAFAAMCLVASSVYLVNDILDAEADRRHPTKKDRPIASGALSIPLAVSGAFAFGGVGLALGLYVGSGLTITLAIYAAISLSYSIALKTFPLIDVFVLASLYTLRIVAGGAATDIEISGWLLTFSGGFFLSLAFMKRFIEVRQSDMAGDLSDRRRGYRHGEDHPLMAMGVASAFVSALVLALYVDSTAARAIYEEPKAIWGFVPLSLFVLCRLWLSAWRGYVHADPTVYAMKDWVTQLSVIGAVGLYVIALFGLPTP